MVSLKAGSWNFSTENIANPETESSGLGAYALEYDYGLSRHLVLGVGLNLLFTDIYTGSSGYGIDLGLKYYPITDSASALSESDQGLISVREVWRPYVGVFLRQRTFNLAISSGYAGPGLSVGLDFAPWDKWFLSAEYRYDLLFGSAGAEAKQSNILLGVGLEL